VNPEDIKCQTCGKRRDDFFGPDDPLTCNCGNRAETVCANCGGRTDGTTDNVCLCTWESARRAGRTHCAKCGGTTYGVLPASMDPDACRCTAWQRVQRFAVPAEPTASVPEAADPTVPWALTHNDKVFLRRAQIDPEK
jgi:hypothetical protein